MHTHMHVCTRTHTIQYGPPGVSLVKFNSTFRVSYVSQTSEEFNSFKIKTKQTGEGKVSHSKGNGSLILLYQY
jgi:hypothetical protein